MHGCGNDFIMLDDRAGHLYKSRAEITKALCDRHEGLGGDGVVLIRKSPSDSPAAFAMTYMNADGIDAELCGNGSRCAVRMAVELGLIQNHGLFLTDAGLMSGRITPAGITLHMPQATGEIETIPLSLDDRTADGFFIHTGVPHLIVPITGLAALDIVRLAPPLRHLARFSPQGTNVNFVERQDERTLAIRTYERGVEGETRACGTGAVAAALFAHRRYGMTPPLSVATRGGCLTIGFEVVSQGSFQSITLTGPAEIIARGEITDEWLNKRGLSVS